MIVTLFKTFEGSDLLTADDISEFQQKSRFALRKPLFFPLNYGDNDLERINGLNGDGQDTLAVRGDFSRGELCARLSAACLRVSLGGYFHVNPYGCRD